MATPFTEDGYTDQQAEAIHQALIEAHLKPDADWPRLFSDITCLVSDVCAGHTHPDTVLFKGDMKQRYAAAALKLEEFLQAYDQLGERLLWHLEDCGFNFRYYGYHETAEAQRQQDAWDAAISASPATPPTPDEPLVCTAAMFDPAQTRPLPGMSFREALEQNLAAIRLAQERPVHEMIAYMQERGARKDHAVRLIVKHLLNIFELATGIEPTVYANSVYARSYNKSNDKTKVNVEYHGTFYPFALACLTPAFPAQELSSAILTAYNECKPTQKKQWADQMKELNRASTPRPTTKERKESPLG